MADIYVRSTDGNNSDDGSTWALAKATVGGAVSAISAGDTVFISDAHNESLASNTTWTFPGTNASPNLIICGDDAAEPPTAVSTAGAISVNAAASLTFAGSFYWYGGVISGGTSGASNINFGASVTQSRVVLEEVTFRLRGGTTAVLALGNTTANFQHELELRNCWVRGSSASHRIYVAGGSFVWRGGGIESGGTAWTGLVSAFGSSGRSPGRFLGESLDLSGLGATAQIFPSSAAGPFLAKLTHCKLPASFTGTLSGSAITTPGYRCEAWNCDETDTNYRLWIEDYAGAIKSETTLVRTGGASDGTTTLAWRMATSADAEYPTHVLRSPPIASEWIDSTGGSKTVTVEILHDSATALDNDEVWIEVQYLGTSGVPLGVISDDCKADVLATPAAQTSSSETWTTTGMSNPHKQKLSVTFTPQEKGVALVTVCAAKASYTVYVDPLATVS
jgi:hypothetical protein